MEHRTWRMALRNGDSGFEMFPICHALGVISLCYQDIDRYDFGKVPFEQIRSTGDWQVLSSSAKSSIHKFAYGMQIGDTVFVKQGPQIVARATVTSDYFYERKSKVVDEAGYHWPHLRKVRWDNQFRPIRHLFGAELHTVHLISSEKLKEFAREYKAAADIEEAYEGQIFTVMQSFRKRNRAIIEAKKRRMAGNFSCELCGYSYQRLMGRDFMGGLQVHHVNPIAEKDPKKPTTIEDLVLMCPNCHAALHSKRPPLTVQQLSELLRKG